MRWHVRNIGHKPMSRDKIPRWHPLARWSLKEQWFNASEKTLASKEKKQYLPKVVWLPTVLVANNGCFNLHVLVKTKPWGGSLRSSGLASWNGAMAEVMEWWSWLEKKTTPKKREESNPAKLVIRCFSIYLFWDYHIYIYILYCIYYIHRHSYVLVISKAFWCEPNGIATIPATTVGGSFLFIALLGVYPIPNQNWGLGLFLGFPSFGSRLSRIGVYRSAGVGIPAKLGFEATDPWAQFFSLHWVHLEKHWWKDAGKHT